MLLPLRAENGGIVIIKLLRISNEMPFIMEKDKQMITSTAKIRGNKICRPPPSQPNGFPTNHFTEEEWP